MNNRVIFAKISEQKRGRFLRYFGLPALFVFFLVSIAPNFLIAQSRAQSELQRLEAERITREKRVGALEKNADQAARDIVALRQRLVQAAKDRDIAERTVEATQTRLITLRRQERVANARLLARRRAVEDVVIALVAVERDRPPALAIKPSNATEAARVAILMRIVAPQLNARARAFAIEIGQIRQMRQDIFMGNAQYRTASNNLIAARQSVGTLISQRQQLEQTLRSDAQTERNIIAQIAQKASGLRDLVARLGQAFPQNNQNSGPNFARGFENSRGKLMAPAYGTIVQQFGADLEEGGKSTGITLRTRQKAQIISPYDGKIEFSAPFRSYGRVLIINVGSGYRIVLAGMGTSYVQAGQEVLAGEPIGEMTEDLRIVPDLYFEIRHNENTINPSLWLITKLNGNG